MIVLVAVLFSVYPANMLPAATTSGLPDSLLRDKKNITAPVPSPPAETSSLLPACIPATDEKPSLERVDLYSPDDTGRDICFTGVVTDDVQLAHIRVVLKTLHGYGYEIVNTPAEGTRLDLSGYCIRNIYELLGLAQGDYEVILTAKDRSGQVASRTFFPRLPERRTCLQDEWGGQCVNYVRQFFGGRLDLMPGLCAYADCGAYHAWDTWELGHGKAGLPAKRSILVLDRDPLEFGHVAVVINWRKTPDGSYVLTVNESNWDQDELIDCNVRYTYFLETGIAIRQGRDRIYRVAGFIYTQEPVFAPISK